MKVKTRKWMAVQLAAGTAVALVTAGCGGGKAQITPEARAAESDPLEITVDQDLLGRLEVGAARMQDVTATLRVAGRVEADERRMARVGAPVTGRITELEINEGEWVKRGQVLATIHSTDLSAAQSSLLKAYSQQQLAERTVARARQLLDAGVIAEAELQRRQADLQQATTEVSSARDQLGVLGMSPEALAQLETTRAVNSITHVVSSIDGMVLERKVTIGQVVEAAETAFVVADLSTVWLVADIPEQSSSGVRPGKVVEAEIPALPGRGITGTLTFVSAVVNPETRTVRTRMDLQNPDLLFKPAMLATMTMLDGAERRRVVPASAIVRENNEDYVFVETRPNTFVLRRVKLGLEFRDVRVLEDGVREGEKIVRNGAFHLNNERRRRAIQGND